MEIRKSKKRLQKKVKDFKGIFPINNIWIRYNNSMEERKLNKYYIVMFLMPISIRKRKCSEYLKEDSPLSNYYMEITPT